MLLRSPPAKANTREPIPRRMRPANLRPTTAISFLLPILLQEGFQLIEFLFGRLAPGERTHQERFRRPVERPMQKITRKLPLCPFRWSRCLVDMRPLFLISKNEAFLGHDL